MLAQTWRSFSDVSARRIRLALAGAVASSLALVPVAEGASPAYVGPNTSTWSTAANWSTSAVPVNGDNVSIGAFTPARTGVTVTVTFNATNLSGTGLASLTLDSVNCQIEDLILNGSGGALIATNETIGNNITLNQVDHSAGNNNVNTLIIGNNAGSSGTYNLSGTGILNANVTEIGNAGTGAFTQNGGTFNNAVAIVIGQLSNTSSSFTLNAGTINGGAEILADNGTGAGVVDTFTQSGGINNVTGTGGLDVGSNGNSTYTLSGGTLNALGTVTETISFSSLGAGVFNQSNGTNNAGTLQIGSAFNTTGFGLYNLQGGNLTTLNGSQTIGNGNLTQTAGINALSNATLIVGSIAGVTANYNLQGGTLSAAGASTEYVGKAGIGVFTETAGNNTLSNGTLIVGDGANGTGTYNLQGGNLSVTGSETIGLGLGSGTVNQSNGTHTVSNGLFIGEDGNGAYNLSNGTLTVTGGEILASSGTTSTFFQSGGTHNITGGLDIAEEQNDLSVGTYFLTGGTLNILGGGFETVGDDGIGALQQSGGVNNVTGILYVGSALSGLPGETDVYTLGAGNLTVAGVEYIGFGTAGHFIQTGGINTANAGLNIGNAFGFTSFYALSGGILATPSLNVNGSPSNFQWTGGTLSLTAGVTFDPAAVGNSTSIAFGNSLSLNSGMNLVVTGNETVGGVGAFTLTLNAGSSDTASGTFIVAPTGTLTQSGGAIGSPFTNQGIFNYFGGTLSGQVTNIGTAFFNASGTVPGGMVNTGNTYLTGIGVTLTISGPGLTNTGSVVVSGGGISGTIGNAGLITGYGFLGSTVSTFNNTGVITQAGGNLNLLSNATPITNTGTINMASGLTLLLSGGSANNSGTINLNSGMLNGSLQLTNNFDGVIIGPGKIGVALFLNNGTLEVPNGTTTAGTFTNNGVIELAGAGAELGPAAGIVTNSATGTIEGLGKVSAAVVNNGTIEPVGGTLNIAGTLTNAANGTLASDVGTKLLVSSGLATNPGLISLTGGTFDNGGHTLTNTGQITGFGTIRTGGLTNSGNMTLTGGTSTVNGNLTNTSGVTLNIKYQPAVFTGTVTNNAGAIIKTTNTTATFAGPFINNGSFVSDPSTNIFQADVNSTGSMTGSTGDVYIFMSGNMTNSGTFNNGGTLQSSDNTTNTGTFTQTGPQQWSNGTVFTNNSPGTATFGSDTGSASASPLSVVVNGGSVSFAASQHLNAITISTGTAAITAGTTKTNALTLGGSTNAWTGDVSIGANKLIVEAAASKGTVLNTLQNEANFGMTHPNGITSAALPAHTGLAVIDNGALATPFTVFGGLSVDTNSILVAPELLGDANIDGHVDLTDLSTVLNNFGAGSTAWTSGNFDGAPAIDLTDLSDVLNNFGSTYANSSAATVSGTGTGLQAAPEPASIALLASGAAILVRRRRPRSG